MKKTITKCPKCGSGCLHYKPDGTILCMACTIKMNKEGVPMKKLFFIGIDSWDRPVYQDESGRLWKDVNLGYGEPSFHSASGNDFEGEPDMPIKDPYETVKKEESSCTNPPVKESAN